MDITEAFKFRDQLQQQMLALVQDFEKKTGLLVDGIDLISSQYLDRPNRETASLTVQVRLPNE